MPAMFCVISKMQSHWYENCGSGFSREARFGIAIAAEAAPTVLVPMALCLT